MGRRPLDEDDGSAAAPKVSVEKLIERVEQLEHTVARLLEAFRDDLGTLREELETLRASGGESRARPPQDTAVTVPPPGSAQRPAMPARPVMPARRTISEELALTRTKRDPRSE